MFFSCGKIVNIFYGGICKHILYIYFWNNDNIMQNQFDLVDIVKFKDTSPN